MDAIPDGLGVAEELRDELDGGFARSCWPPDERAVPDFADPAVADMLGMV